MPTSAQPIGVLRTLPPVQSLVWVAYIEAVVLVLLSVYQFWLLRRWIYPPRGKAEMDVRNLRGVAAVILVAMGPAALLMVMDIVFFATVVLAVSSARAMSLGAAFVAVWSRSDPDYTFALFGRKGSYEVNLGAMLWTTPLWCGMLLVIGVGCMMLAIISYKHHKQMGRPTQG